jgi:hypothetical protein
VAGIIHSPTILMYSDIGPAEQLRLHVIAVIVEARLERGSIAESWLGAYFRRSVALPFLDYCR